MTPTFLSFKSGASSHAKNEQKQKQRRVSLGSVPTMGDKKGKGPIKYGDMSPNEEFGQPVWSSRGYDPFASSPLSHGLSSSRPSTSSGIPSSHTRQVQKGGMFAAASDALGLKLGLVRRKDTLPKQFSESAVLPDVVEITARQREEEEEERNRLRVEAAQAIGLVDMDAQSYHTDNDEEDEEAVTRRGDVHNLSESVYPANGTRSSMFSPHTTFVQGHGSSISVAVPCPTAVGRYRPSSLSLGGGGSHSRANSVNLTPVPTYPTIVSSLAQWQQLAGMLPKYYPPSSLRIFTLSNSKNWKPRYIMLTSPTTIITRAKTPAVSYLHLFNGSGPDEKELERLVINEDSVVFVSDDEVGGKRHVIKVEGIEGSIYKEELSVEESGRTMWFLQIEDHAESKKWISGIKSSILNQRALRAGLMSATGTDLGVNEHRRDIDMILSMRAQGRSSSNTRQHRCTPPSTAPAAHPEQNLPSPSEHPLHSQISAPRMNTVLGVSALKGLFSGSRSRSGSRTTSVDTSRLLSQHHPTQQGASLDLGEGSPSSNLSGILRFAMPDIQSQSSGAIAPTTASIFRPSSPVSTPLVASGVGLDRHITVLDEKEGHERQFSFASANTPPVTPNSPIPPGKMRAAKSLSLGSISLQPPPRGKRWTSATVMRPPSPAVSLISPLSNGPQMESTSVGMYKDVQLNDTTGSLGALSYSHYNKDTELSFEPGSPTTNSMTTGSTDSHHIHYQDVQSSSAQSISTYSAAASNGDDSLLLSSIKPTGSSQGMRRWSRQGQGSLPPRTSPPAGPPPNPPSNVQSSSSSHSIIGGGMDRPNSCASSSISSQNQQRVVSSLPSFLKRTSVSSVQSTSTSNSYSGNGHGHGHVVRGPGSHRSSVPPPRPAPTSALPPAPEEQNIQRLSPTPNSPSRNQNLIPRVRAGRIRPRSADSSVPSPTSTQAKRGSITGRGFRLSVIAPSKPPPSSSLPPRPDELGGVNESPPPSASFRGTSGSPSGLPRLTPIPASPDPSNTSASASIGVGCGTAPFPPPKGPLPPTPSSSDNNMSPATGASKHASLKQRLRIHSAPSFSSMTSQGAGTDVSGAGGACSTSAQALCNISNTTSNISVNNFTVSPQQILTPSHNHTQIRSPFTPRFPHHFRHSSSTSNHNSSAFVRSPSSLPTPVPHSPSYPYCTVPGGDFSRQPSGILIGEKIMSMQDEVSFLNLVSDTPISPTPPSSLPSPLLSYGSLSSVPMGGVVSNSEMTSLSPPPRRNSKQMVAMVEHHNLATGLPSPSTKPSTPRTPPTPSIFEDTFGVEAGKAKRDDNAIEQVSTSSSLPLLHSRDRTFGRSDSPLSIDDSEDTRETQKSTLSLSLPPSGSAAALGEVSAILPNYS